VTDAWTQQVKKKKKKKEQSDELILDRGLHTRTLKNLTGSG